RRWFTAAIVTLSNLPWVTTWAQVTEEQRAKIQAALPSGPYVQPHKPRKLLVYSRTRGFRHASIPVGQEMTKLLGEKTGAFTATITEDPSFFEPEKLKEFDAVLMLNTTGNCFSEDHKQWEGNLAKDELIAADNARADRLM